MNVTERIYEQLLQQIVDGSIAPGTVLEERKLSESLEVSRTPLRSALNQLLGEGMLERLSNGSLAVKVFSSSDLLEMLQIRILLEAEAAASAAGRIPKDDLLRLAAALDQATEDRDSGAEWQPGESMHELIAMHCGNKALRTLITSVKRQSALCRVEHMPHRVEAAHDEHLAIVRALLSADGAAARQAMTEHLKNVQRSYIDSLLGHNR